MGKKTFMNYGLKTELKSWDNLVNLCSLVDLFLPKGMGPEGLSLGQSSTGENVMTDGNGSGKENIPRSWFGRRGENLRITWCIICVHDHTISEGELESDLHGGKDFEMISTGASFGLV